MKSWTAKLEYANHLSNIQDSPHLFAVITWGCSASTWLAQTLNSLPDLFCTHALNQHLTLSLPEKSSITDLEFFRALQISSHQYKVAGDVHGIDRHSIPRLRSYFKNKFSCIALVRDPLDRLLSTIACSKKLKGAYCDYSYIYDLIEKNNIVIETTRDNILLIHSINMLNAIIDEKKLCSAIYRMEDITSSPTTMKDLIRYLSGNNIIISENRAAKLVEHTPKNRHASPQITTHMTQEQKQIINKLVHNEAIEIYKSLGYDTDRLLR